MYILYIIDLFICDMFIFNFSCILKITTNDTSNKTSGYLVIGDDLIMSPFLCSSFPQSFSWRHKDDMHEIFDITTRKKYRAKIFNIYRALLLLPMITVYNCTF